MCQSSNKNVPRWISSRWRSYSGWFSTIIDRPCLVMLTSSYGAFYLKDGVGGLWSTCCRWLRTERQPSVSVIRSVFSLSKMSIPRGKHARPRLRLATYTFAVNELLICVELILMKEADITELHLIFAISVIFSCLFLRRFQWTRYFEWRPVAFSIAVPHFPFVIPNEDYWRSHPFTLNSLVRLQLPESAYDIGPVKFLRFDPFW